MVVLENFMMFDNRMVKVEGHTAEITITQPREIALYGRAFDTLAGQSATGDRARELIRAALEKRTPGADEHSRPVQGGGPGNLTTPPTS